MLGFYQWLAYLGKWKYPTPAGSRFQHGGREILVFHVGEGKYSTPAHAGHPLPPKGRERTKKHVEFTIQRHRLTKILRPNSHRAGETSPPPTSHITEVLFTTIPFTQYNMSGYQGKITRHTKTKNKKQKNTVWRDIGSIKTRLSYGRKFGIIGLGI